MFSLEAAFDLSIFRTLKTRVLFKSKSEKYRAALQSSVLLRHLQNSTRLKETTPQTPKGHGLTRAQFTPRRLISTQSCKGKQGDVWGSAHLTQG